MKTFKEQEVCDLVAEQLSKFNPAQEQYMIEQCNDEHISSLVNAINADNYIEWSCDNYRLNKLQLNNNKRNDIVLNLGGTIVIMEVKATNYLFSNASNKITGFGVHRQLLIYALRLMTYSQATKKLQLLVILPDNYKIKCSKKLNSVGIDTSNDKQAIDDFIKAVCTDVAEKVEGSDVQIQSRLMFYKSKSDINVRNKQSPLINY